MTGSPAGLAVDTVNNEIIVTDSLGIVRVYDRTASGTASPKRTLSGPATMLDYP